MVLIFIKKLNNKFVVKWDKAILLNQTEVKLLEDAIHFLVDIVRRQLKYCTIILGKNNGWRLMLMHFADIIEYIIPINFVLTIWLTFKQVTIDNQSLRLNLYEKRYHIYEITIIFLGDFLRTSLSKDPSDKMINMLYEYKINVHQSIFLFNDKMEEYLLKIYDYAESVRIKKLRQQDYIQDIEWLEKQIVESRQKFKPYMKFKKL